MKDKRGKVAILIVNGGQDPIQGKWLSLCINKIIQHTRAGSYHIYIWNNNIDDAFVEPFVQFIPDCTLVQASSNISLSHVHADPLHRLYKQAKNKGAEYIVTMDSDAHPVRDGWLDTLVQQLEQGAVLAGAWRDELRAAISPYVHASCLATSVRFIEENGLRLDNIPPNENKVIHDTLSQFTRKAQQIDGQIYRWMRSNHRQFHRLMGGIYGGYIYHHGAGSRAHVSFWDEPKDPNLMARNSRIGQIATHLLLSDYDNYMSWLAGKTVAAQTQARLQQLADSHLELFTDIPIPHPKGATSPKGIRRALSTVLKKMREESTKRRKHIAKKPGPLMTRPFSRDDFLAKTTETHKEFPDFVGVGVPKAGTSWWYAALLDHPSVANNRLTDRTKAQKTKELDYFTHFVDRPFTEADQQVYRSAFASPEGKICGEWTTTYLAHPLSLIHLASAAPDTKILVMVRNPVDRFLSHIDHLVRNRASGFRLDENWKTLFKVHSAVPEAFLHSCYARPLEKLVELFDRKKSLFCSMNAVA